MWFQYWFVSISIPSVWKDEHVPPDSIPVKKKKRAFKVSSHFSAMATETSQ